MPNWNRSSRDFPARQVRTRAAASDRVGSTALFGSARPALQPGGLDELEDREEQEGDDRVEERGPEDPWQLRSAGLQAGGDDEREEDRCEKEEVREDEADKADAPEVSGALPLDLY